MILIELFLKHELLKKARIYSNLMIFLLLLPLLSFIKYLTVNIYYSFNIFLLKFSVNFVKGIEVNF